MNKLPIPAACSTCEGTGKYKSTLTMMEQRCVLCNGTGVLPKLLPTNAFAVFPGDQPASAPVASIRDDNEFHKLVMAMRAAYGPNPQEPYRAMIAHIDAWGKQQRHEQHKVDAELISTLQAAQLEMRERAEKAEAALSECRAALEVANAWRLELESPPAKPQGCTGTPSCCPDNEGYGCACTPVRTTSDAAYESLSPERRKKFDADMVLLDQLMQDHRRERDRRQNKVPVEVERRVADARGTGVHQDRKPS